MKLGRVRSIQDERTLDLANYVAVHRLLVADAVLPPSPNQDMIHKQDCLWPMLANDRYPCCTSAAAGHMVHHWTEVNGHLVLLTEQNIIDAYQALSGGSGKDGVSMLEALKYWRKTGIGDHKIHSFVKARLSRAELKCVVHLFGSAYVGLDLPNFAYSSDPSIDPATIPAIPWNLSTAHSPEDSKPQESNGHCVAAVGYDTEFVYVVTWGILKTMSWEFYEKYAFESFAVLSHDWVNDAKLCPSGFDLTILERDLNLVKTLHRS